MAAFETITYTVTNYVGRVTLNRPERLNTYNLRMRDELFQVLGAIKEDPEVRVAILSGAGDRAFCAGADISEFLGAPSPVIARQVRWERDVWGVFLSINKPLIAALHGFVLGSGLEMALCCDIRIASNDARFGLPEARLGIMPAAGGSQTAPRTIGPGPTLDMLLNGRWLDAAEAHRLKLVNRVVSRQELMPTAEAFANRILSNDQLAVSLAKEAMRRGLDLSLGEGLELEGRLAKRLFNRSR